MQPLNPSQPVRNVRRIGVYSAVLIALCALPLLLMAAGVNFGNCPYPAATVDAVDVDSAHRALCGSFWHMALEWSAVSAACFVGLLCVIQTVSTGQRSLPVIGAALMCAGAMDGYHILISTRLVGGAADSVDLAPFSWALARMFNATMFCAALCLFTLYRPKQEHSKRFELRVISCVCIAFVVALIVVVQATTTAGQLPQTMRPDAFIKRPYDIIPLMLFAGCGILLLPSYLRSHHGVFADSLLLSLIPQIAAQLYMAFGSDALHDASFNVAHGMKAIGYLVPALGMAFDYVRSYRQQVENQIKLQESQQQVLASQVEAYRANAAKSDFLAKMSHEIRTPLAAIIGFADVLETQLHAVGTAAQNDAVQVIQRNGKHLLELINDILDISKVEAGRLVIEKLPCRPRDLLAEVHSVCHAKAYAKGLDFRLSVAEDLPEVIETDPLRLRQILVNIAGNAVKFTATGFVEIAAGIERGDEGNQRLRFDVRDTGIGIAPDKTQAIFDPFTQEDASTTRKFGGTGLGLAISRRLAELLDGQLTLTSQLGEGSCFTVSLPLKELAASTETAPPVIESPPAKRRSASKGELRVLVAEDGVDNQQLIKFYLKKVGIAPLLCENGQIAVEAAQREEFDVILMDMQMPVMDGYEATRTLRSLGYTGPIIALTANAMSGDREKCLDAGCSDFLTKPIDRVKLLELVTNAATSECV